MTISRRPIEREIVLGCNRCFSPDVLERFPFSTEIKAVARWARARGWRIRHLFGERYEHICPRCVLVTKTSEDYVERLHA